MNCCIQHWVKALLQQGIPEPIFYGDLVYEFNRMVGKPNFSDQFKKIIKRYIKVEYNQGGTSFVIFYVFVLSSVCYVFVRVCIYVLCGHLLGEG